MVDVREGHFRGCCSRELVGSFGGIFIVFSVLMKAFPKLVDGLETEKLFDCIWASYQETETETKKPSTPPTRKKKKEKKSTGTVAPQNNPYVFWGGTRY